MRPLVALPSRTQRPSIPPGSSLVVSRNPTLLNVLYKLPQVPVMEPKLLLADESLFQDLWQDAQMPEVIEYLRGAKSLDLPPEWKAVFPKSL